MRKLMWFSIGFGLSCAIGAYGMNCNWLLPGAVAICILFVVAVGFTRKKSAIRRAIAVLTGGLAGLAWFGIYHLIYLQPVALLDGQDSLISITASDYSYDTGYGIGVDGTTVIEGKPYQVRTYLQDVSQLQPGDQVEGTFRLWLTTVDEMNPSTYYQGKGIFLFAHQQEDVSGSPASEIPGWCFPAVLRQKILRLLEDAFPQDTVPFVKALLIGDGQDLDYETDSAFKISGSRHINEVPGLHISILYGLICIVTLRRRYLTALVGMPVLLLFAAVAGFTPSVVRSCIMVWLMMIALIFDREYDPATALGFAVLVMLIANPMAVTSVSLQLSVFCVAGILLFNGRINGWLKNQRRVKKGITSRLWSMFCSSISVTLSAMTLVTPLSAFYFGTVSLVSVLTNILTLWVVNLIFNGLVAVCLLYLLSPEVAGGLAWLLSWPVRYVLGMAKMLAAFPLAAVYTKSIYIVSWLVFVYILLAVFLAMKRKQPGVLFCCGTIGLCLALLASWAEPLTADTQITMLDVGQGQAVLLQSEGKTFLVDCGGDNDERAADIVAETLLSQGIPRLDGIILTHYDRDHAGGAEYLLSRIDTGVLILPPVHSEHAFRAEEILYGAEDLLLSSGNTEIRVFSSPISGDDNENSLCVLFDTEKCDILITGDRDGFGERMLLRKITDLDIDVLVAGHHGSKYATCEELLTAVRPEIVCISAGRNNSFGHPAPELLQRLDHYGCSVYRTDLQGNIIIRR